MANTSGDTAAVEIEAQEQALAEPLRDRSPESLADLFAPDVVLPEQFFEGARRDSQASGEKALMLAVLEDGIRCFQEHLRNPRSNPRLLSQQAEAWIRAVDYEWPFSFNNVCETLGIDPSALRAALLAWKAKGLVEREANGGATPAAKKVYPLPLRTRSYSILRGGDGSRSRRRQRSRSSSRTWASLPASVLAFAAAAVREPLRRRRLAPAMV